MKRCTKCLMSAIIYQKYSGLYLCETHFFEDVERKFKLTIRNEYNIKKNDRIIIAYSGGKDSSLLLYLFHKYFSVRRDIDIISITIDEGIKGYRDVSIKKVVDFVNKLGVKHYLFSFEDEYNITMDKFTKFKENNKSINKNISNGPCSFCGVLRRKLLNNISKKLNGTKLAIGHNLDDEAQTIMLNYLSGNINQMSYFLNKKEKDGFISRIKPLKRIPEQEVALYSYLKGLPMEIDPCPYSNNAYRKEIRYMLNNIESKHPGTKYSILRGIESISTNIIKKNVNMNYCKKCGDPCNGLICQACKYLSIYIHNIDK